MTTTADNLRLYMNELEETHEPILHATFSRLFSLGVELNKLSYDEIARQFSANRTTAERWIRGASFPAVGCRELILTQMLEITKNTLSVDEHIAKIDEAAELRKKSLLEYTLKELSFIHDRARKLQHDLDHLSAMYLDHLSDMYLELDGIAFTIAEVAGALEEGYRKSP